MVSLSFISFKHREIVMLISGLFVLLSLIFQCHSLRIGLRFGLRQSIALNVATDRPTLVHHDEVDFGLEQGVVDVVFDSTLTDKLSSSEADTTVVFFTAPCPQCARAKLVVEELAAKSDNLQVLTMDADRNPSTVERYGIRSVPTLLVLNRMGEVVGEAFGATLPLNRIQKMITKARAFA